MIDPLRKLESRRNALKTEDYFTTQAEAALAKAQRQVGRMAERGEVEAKRLSGRREPSKLEDDLARQHGPFDFWLRVKGW